MLDIYSPRTNFILGAALFGGDPIKAAKLLMERDNDSSDRLVPSTRDSEDVIQSELAIHTEA